MNNFLTVTLPVVIAIASGTWFVSDAIGKNSEGIAVNKANIAAIKESITKGFTTVRTDIKNYDKRVIASIEDINYLKGQVALLSK